MSPRARIYFDCVVGTGLYLLLEGISQFAPADLSRFVAYLVAAMLAATLRVRVPGTPLSLSPAFAFVLIGIAEWSLGEAMVIACVAALVQCVWKPPVTRSARKVAFNMAATAMAVTLAHSAHFMLPLAALVFFLVNTGLAGAMIALKDQVSFRAVWWALLRHTLPNYLLGGLIAMGTVLVNRSSGWRAGLLLVPLLGLVHWCYRAYARRRGAETA